MRKDSAREMFQEMTFAAGVKVFSYISYTQKEIRNGTYLEKLSHLLEETR
jgi:hypothetical protein